MPFSLLTYIRTTLAFSLSSSVSLVLTFTDPLTCSVLILSFFVTLYALLGSLLLNQIQNVFADLPAHFVKIPSYIQARRKVFAIGAANWGAGGSERWLLSSCVLIRSPEKNSITDIGSYVLGLCLAVHTKRLSAAIWLPSCIAFVAN